MGRSRTSKRKRYKGVNNSGSIIAKMSKSVLKTYLANPDDYDMSLMTVATKGRYTGKVTTAQLEAAKKK